MDTIIFAIGVAGFFVVPGLLILGRIGIPLQGLARFNVAIIVGIISSSIIYKLFGYLGLPWMTVIYFMLAAAAYAVISYRKRDRLKLQLPESGSLIVYLFFLILVAYTAYQYTQIPYYSLNLVTSGDGTISVVKNKDALLHLSLVNEIARDYPPSTPFISGVELKYHYGMDLLSALFVKYLGFSAGDAALRFMPLFAMSLALLSIFTLVRELGGSLLSALIISFLVIWADDFTYLLYQFGMVGNGFEGMAALLSHTAPTFVSLFAINPMIYGVAFLFTAFLLVDKYTRTQNNGYLILCAIIICYAGNFKVFITLQILAALSILTLWEIYKDRCHITENAIFKLFVTTMLVFVVMYYPTIIDSLRGESLIKMELQLFTNYIPGIIKHLGLNGVSPIDTLYVAYIKNTPSFMVILLLIIAVLIYTCFSFGLRCISFPYLYAEIKNGKNVVLVLAAMFVLIGPLLTLFMSVRPLHGLKGYNNSVWFMVQSKYVAWLFLFIPLTNMLILANVKTRKFIINMLIVAIFAYLAIYSVKANRLLLDYYKYDPIHQPVILDEKYSNILDLLMRSCENGDVFISDNYWISYMLVGSGCRTVLFADWGGTFASVQELSNRRDELKLFWEGYYDGMIDYELLEKYQVKYVINGKTFELITN